METYKILKNVNTAFDGILKNNSLLCMIFFKNKNCIINLYSLNKKEISLITAMTNFIAFFLYL